MNNNILCLCDDILELVIVEVGHEREKLKNLKKFKSNLKEGLKLIKRSHFDLVYYQFVNLNIKLNTDSYNYNFIRTDYTVERPLYSDGFFGNGAVNICVEECPVVFSQFYEFKTRNEDLGVISQLDLIKINIKRIKTLQSNLYDWYNKNLYIERLEELFLLKIEKPSKLKKGYIKNIFDKYIELVESGEFDKVFNFVKSTSDNKTVYVRMSNLEEYDIIINKKL